MTLSANEAMVRTYEAVRKEFIYLYDPERENRVFSIIFFLWQFILVATYS